MENQTYTNAVIYARFSSSGQREESIEGQVRECKEFAKRYNLNVIGEYCDYAISGTSDRRPEFQRMIRDSAKKQFSVVITWKNDRFARSRYDSATYKYKLKQNGVSVMYAKESIPDGPEGIILESVMEGYAEYYSANLSQNVKRGLYDSALKLQTLGQTCYGLRKGADSRWEQNPDTAPVVKRIFEEYAAGKPAVEIVRELNEAGYRTLTGKRFHKDSIRRILSNEKYVGVYKYADIRVEDGIPAIVDRDTFDRVQIMMRKHHEAPAAKKNEGGFLLTTKLFCGQCGEPMTGDSGTSKNGNVYEYYTCNKRRAKKCNKERAPKKWVEDIVIENLFALINSDEVVNEFVDDYMKWQENNENHSELDGLNDRLRKVESSIKNIMTVIDNGLITEGIKNHLIELESEKADLIKGVAQKHISDPHLDRKDVEYFLKQFRDGNTNDPEWRVYFVDTLLRAAYLFDDGRLLLVLNHSGKNNKVTLMLALDVIEKGRALCSSFASPTPPKTTFA